MILVLPGMIGVNGIYFAQPVADVLTLAVCLVSYPALTRLATLNMEKDRKA